jgi:hypothetical protein
VFELGLVVKPGKLLRPRDEPLAVGVFGLAFGQKMNVVRHVAVREKCNVLLLRGGALNLRTNYRYCFVGYEALSTMIGTKREEILIETKVVKPLQVFRPVSEHAAVTASSVPSSG